MTDPEPCDLSRRTAAERAVHILAKPGVRTQREAVRVWWTATRGWPPSLEARRRGFGSGSPVTPDHHQVCPSPSGSPATGELHLLRPSSAARSGNKQRCPSVSARGSLRGRSRLLGPHGVGYPAIICILGGRDPAAVKEAAARGDRLLEENPDLKLRLAG